MKPACPMCRGAVKSEQLIDPPPPPLEPEGDADTEPGDGVDDTEDDRFESSPKIDALLEFLKGRFVDGRCLVS